MAKTLKGTVLSVKMNKAAVVEITRRVPHPKYKKLMRKSKKFSVALNGNTVKVGDVVSISETRPVAKTIHFEISKANNEKGK